MNDLLEEYLAHLQQDIKDSTRILILAVLAAVSAWLSGFFLGRLFP